MRIRFEGWVEGRFEGGLKHGSLKVLQTKTIFVSPDHRWFGARFEGWFVQCGHILYQHYDFDYI